MEHTLSVSTLDSLTDFMEFIQSCPRTGESWLQYFDEYRGHGRIPGICKARSKGFSCEFRSQVESIEESDSVDFME
jgi:DtxR family transcriptional regulator, Mn-dependent transcriptional regulator